MNEAAKTDIRNKPENNRHMSTRSFLKLAGSALGGVVLGGVLSGCGPNEPEQIIIYPTWEPKFTNTPPPPTVTSTNTPEPSATFEPKRDDFGEQLLNFYKDKGIVFDSKRVFTLKKEIEVSIAGDTGLALDQDKLMNLFLYFETMSTKPRTYRVVKENEAITVNPVMRNLNKGKIVVVNSNDDIPDVVKNVAADYPLVGDPDKVGAATITYRYDNSDQFVILVRVPDAGKLNENEISQSILGSTIVEACNSTLALNFLTPYINDDQVSLSSQRVWAGDILCSTYDFFAKKKNDGLTYKDISERYSDLDLGIEINGSLYHFNYPLPTEKEWNLLPTESYLVKK